MSKLCDNKSVGMLVWRDGKLLLVERKRPPFGFAPPAGHVDEDKSFEVAAKRELKEEVGLEADSMELLMGGGKIILAGARAEIGIIGKFTGLTQTAK